jgi:orotate phosphoribosyltransferase
MSDMRPQKVKLPSFVIDSELSRKLNDHASGLASDRIVFDWSDVCFFDDYTLLKLLFLQKQLRSTGKRVSNTGFFFAYRDPDNPAVLRQLWAVGLPELTASGHLFAGETLRNVLIDDAQLLGSDPLHGLQLPTAATAVVPMLCCHDIKHFTAGSREEKQLDSFIRTCLRPSGQKSLAWDLVETREFRHLLVQQLRRNVQEHSCPQSGVAIGLAIARVWTDRSLSDEWGLTEELKAQLLRIWNQEPVPLMLQKLAAGRALLQISIVDDGTGIPHNLDTVHAALVRSATQQQLFDGGEQLHYHDEAFENRFAGPTFRFDKKARLIAFSTDSLGTSKPDRAPELKGLQYLREQAVIERGGAVCIESDGAAIDHINNDQPYGKPRRMQLGWCATGGTGICLAVPMSPVESSGDSTKLLSQKLEFGAPYATPGSKPFKVKDFLNSQLPNGNSSKQKFAECANAIIREIVLPTVENDIAQLRKRGLLLIDWGELPDSKRIFHYLLSEIAKGLAAADPQQMRPFIFVNLPTGLCGLLGKAMAAYSTPGSPTPIRAFASERREPFWLGLDGDNSLPEELRRRITCETRRKLTEQKENRTEAFHRDCLAQLLAQSQATSLSDSRVLQSARHEYHESLRHSLAFQQLNILVRRCPLFREEERRTADGEVAYTGRFRPVFTLSEIVSEVRRLFLDQFCAVFTEPPVCFVPGKGKGVRLPHSDRVLARYFRSDALVDSSIAPELTQELTAIALGIAGHVAGGRIDWVVSCTSPLHWFVHRMVDGLAENGITCSHHVFPSYEAIEPSTNEIGMHPGETVLVFTDVIASGRTAYRMAECMVSRFQAKMAGLIAFADIRSAEDKTAPALEHFYGERIVCLYNVPEPQHTDLEPTYYVHPETVVPKRGKSSPTDDFFEMNYSGFGPLVENHTYFRSPKRTLDLITSLGAVRFGHFQHGGHHSEIFVDVEKVLGCREYLNLMITALFQYIVANEIRLVVYPSHSSAYMLADELKQRFGASESSVEFSIACRTFAGARGTSYALTRFSPQPDPHWRSYSKSAVLILDDAVCTGATVKSIMAELARINQNYYEGQTPSYPHAAQSDFSVHLVAFLNRLPRVTGDFWRGLARVTGGKVQFSAFMSMPLAADPAGLCPQCHIEEELEQANHSATDCGYAKEFLSWWISRNAAISSHERRHLDNQDRGRFSSEEALRIAGYPSAIERNGYDTVCDRLFDKAGTPAEEKSRAVRVLIRSRSAFLHGLAPKSEEPAFTLAARGKSQPTDDPRVGVWLAAQVR